MRKFLLQICNCELPYMGVSFDGKSREPQSKYIYLYDVYYNE